VFNLSGYKHNGRQQKVSFSKLIYDLRARRVQIDVEKQNIVRVRGQFFEGIDRIVGRIEVLHVAPCRQDIRQSRLCQRLIFQDQHAHGFQSPSILPEFGVPGFGLFAAAEIDMAVMSIQKPMGSMIFFMAYLFFCFALANLDLEKASEHREVIRWLGHLLLSSFKGRVAKCRMQRIKRRVRHLFYSRRGILRHSPPERLLRVIFQRQGKEPRIILSPQSSGDVKAKINSRCNAAGREAITVLHHHG
jgi:hypothetical protein